MTKKDEIAGIERRKFPRLNDNIFISYRLGQKICKAIAKNISCGGLMFEAEKKVPVGMEVDFEIYQPVNCFKTVIFVIPASAKVVWRRKIKYGFLETGQNQYKVGVCFTKIKNEDRERIKEYVAVNLNKGS